MLKKNNNTIFCLHPVVVKGALFPCGRCLNCQRRKIVEWANRLKMEYLDKDKDAYFVTLTYSEEFVDDYKLHKEDLQKFFKRLRINYKRIYCKDNYLSFFSCGEYGGKKGRPHFHFIIYNTGLLYNDIQSLVSKSWQKGFVDIEYLDKRHFTYISKYSVKQLRNKDKGEFITMSRKMAIGKNYLLNNRDKIKKGEVVFNRNDFFRVPSTLNKFVKDKMQKKKIVNIIVKSKDDICNFDSYYEILSRVYKVKDFDELNFVLEKDFKNNLQSNSQKAHNFLFKKRASVSCLDNYNYNYNLDEGLKFYFTYEYI